MAADDLWNLVASLFGMPCSAVKLIHKGQVYTSGLRTDLRSLGVAEGSELVLLQPSEASGDTFSITINTIAGERREVGGLHVGLTVHELCEKTAGLFSIPDFAVRLLHQGEVHVSGSAALLPAAGIGESSELLLLKQWGWAKPDLSLLQGLQKRFGGA